MKQARREWTNGFPKLSLEDYARIYKVVYKQGWSTDSKTDQRICNALRSFLKQNRIDADAP